MRPRMASAKLVIPVALQEVRRPGGPTDPPYEARRLAVQSGPPAL